MEILFETGRANMASPATDSGAAKGAGSYAHKLELFENLRRPLLAEALAWLNLPQGGRGLDAGCGVGLHLELLLNAISPGGRVTGLDLSPDLLDRARALVAKKKLGQAIDLKQADIKSLPFDDASLDWVWSLDCAGYMPGDKAALIKELTRVLKPGGRLALMAYSTQQLLPGYPGLEARLNATKAGQAPFAPGDAPGDHFLRLPERLSQAGLIKIRARSFIAEFSAPLEPAIREALLELMDMRWGAVQAEVSAADWELFSRLCRPDSPECILEQPGYYGFFTYTMFSAVKPS
jgi:SAM-dependent methyltransferase